MSRGVNVLLALAVLALSAAGEAQTPQDTAETEWVVAPSPGLDAILFVGALSGDRLQADIHAEAIAEMTARLSPEARAALERLDRGMREAQGLLTGPVMANYLSAGPTGTIAEVIATARHPETSLWPRLERTPGWEAEEAERVFALMPDMILVLEGLEAAGFSDWYTARCGGPIEAAVEDMQSRLAPYDIIPLQERLVGRNLEPRIEIDLMCFAKPYGISVYGQRFLAQYDYDAETQLRVAAHEIFHPPFDLEDEALFARLEALEADPWIRSIVENHDPAFGYNSFSGVVNEDSTQALDQIVSEQLGVARDPVDRWRRADGGMHMLAAALYHAMKEDGFDRRGGRYEDWLKFALDRGLLTPQEVRRRAAEIVGEDSVRHWYEIAVPEE